GIRPLVEHDINAVILHGRVEVLFHGLGDAVDLIDEEDVAFFKAGEHACEVSGALHHGAGSDTHLSPHLVAQYVRERGLSQPRRTGQEHVTQHIPALAGGTRDHAQPFDGCLLAGKVIEARWTERFVHHLILVEGVIVKTFFWHGAAAQYFHSTRAAFA